jgi:Chromate transporter
MAPSPPVAAAVRASGARASLVELVRYFLYLGPLGFGGPVALAGFVHRDLVQQRRWIDEEEYRLGLALAQIMPGPRAAHLAIALGYFQYGVLGATLVGAPQSRRFKSDARKLRSDEAQAVSYSCSTASGFARLSSRAQAGAPANPSVRGRTMWEGAQGDPLQCAEGSPPPAHASQR